MSRLYDNQPLSNLPVHNVVWSGTWDHQAQVTTAKAKSTGILLEGAVNGKARISVSGSQNPSANKTRYYILYSTIERAHQRKFDSEGKEIEPNFSETTKVSTGYLNSSYGVKAKGDSDRLTASAVKSSLSASPVNSLLQKIPNGPENTAALFMREEDLNKLELPTGSSVRVKTAGDSPFVETLVVREEGAMSRGNFTGDESVGGNWTDKIMAVKVGNTDSNTEQESEIADDEWDD